MRFFQNCNSIEELKKEFKRLALLHHPDKGGETATMQKINAEYQERLKRGFKDAKEQTEDEQKADVIYPEIIEKLIFLEGITIEIIGSWLWVSGNTYPHREILKELNFNFSRAKTMWYFRPAEQKAYNPRPWSIDKIRAAYGSDEIETVKTKRVDSKIDKRVSTV